MDPASDSSSADGLQSLRDHQGPSRGLLAGCAGHQQQATASTMIGGRAVLSTKAPLDGVGAEALHSSGLLPSRAGRVFANSLGLQHLGPAPLSPTQCVDSGSSPAQCVSQDQQMTEHTYITGSTTCFVETAFPGSQQQQSSLRGGKPGCLDAAAATIAPGLDGATPSAAPQHHQDAAPSLEQMQKLLTVGPSDDWDLDTCYDGALDDLMRQEGADAEDAQPRAQSASGCAAPGQQAQAPLQQQQQQQDGDGRDVDEDMTNASPPAPWHPVGAGALDLAQPPPFVAGPCPAGHLQRGDMPSTQPYPSSVAATPGSPDGTAANAGDARPHGGAGRSRPVPPSWPGDGWADPASSGLQGGGAAPSTRQKRHSSGVGHSHCSASTVHTPFSAMSAMALGDAAAVGPGGNAGGAAAEQLGVPRPLTAQVRGLRSAEATCFLLSEHAQLPRTLRH